MGAGGIIGLILGGGTLIAFVGLIARLWSRIIAKRERRPVLIFGDVVNVPEEMWTAARKGAGGESATEQGQPSKRTSHTAHDKKLHRS